jgi:ankyrin repeat protein
MDKSNIRPDVILEMKRANTKKWRLIHRDMTPLMKAAVHEDLSELVEMVSLGNIQSSLFVKDAKGRTAIDWARICRNDLAVAVLRKAMDANMCDSRIEAVTAKLDMMTHTVDVNNKHSEDLFFALKELKDEKVVLKILKRNRLFRAEVVEIKGESFFIDKHDTTGGYTPLMYAAGFNMIEAVALLIDMDVAIDDVNKFGHTAFTWACTGGHTDVVKLLLFKGCNINHITDEGRGGLHYACLYVKARTVKALVDFLFERFATFRLKHTQKKFDYTRWSKYATFMDDFINVIILYFIL